MQRFLFETSFDSTASVEPLVPTDLDVPEPEDKQPAEAPPEPQEPPALTLSERELVEEKAKAFSEGEAHGREAALAEAAASVEQRCSGLLEEIAAKLPDSLRAEESAYRAASQESLALAQAALKKIFPRLEQRAALAEVEALVEASLAQLRQEPRVVLRLPDALLDPMRERLDGLTHSHGFEGKVVLLADPELGPSDVRVEFADGGMERCARQLWAEIESRILEVGAHGDTAEPAPESPPSPPSPPSPHGQDEAA